MSGQIEGDGPGREALEEALARGERDAAPEEVGASDERIQALLDHVAPSERSPRSARAPDGELAWDEVSHLTALPVALDEGLVTVRAGRRSQRVALGEGVSARLIHDAIAAGQRVLLERVGTAAPTVVGVIQTSAQAKLSGTKVEIEASEELVLRSGRAAIRMRSDGDVELVGSRISAMSRGLFRLVGRVLRLN